MAIIQARVSDEEAEMIKNYAKKREMTVSEVIRTTTMEKIKTESRRDLFGCMKGNILYIADDFDEPLEDFKEYME